MQIKRQKAWHEGRLKRVIEAIEEDIQKVTYDGAVLMVAHEGEVVLQEARGFADRAAGRPMRLNDVFSIFSLAKSMTAASVFLHIEEGRLLLTTPVQEIIPEFGVKGKHRVNIAHLLTHTAGLSSAMPQVPFELLGNLHAVTMAVCQESIMTHPGQAVTYSSTGGYAILGEIARRLDGGQRSFREMIAKRLLEPLKMHETAFGFRKDLLSRKVPVIFRGRNGLFPPEAIEAADKIFTEETEIPGGIALSTAQDLFRWVEMLRLGGELEGVRVLSPAMLQLAATNHTGDKPNNLWNYAREERGWDEFPALLGLGFFLRGNGIFPTPFGMMASPKTFGCLGLGSHMFWVDPERQVTCIYLTAGLIEESRHLERLQRISDLIWAAKN